MRESVEMYLLRTALLQQSAQPVPLTQLAQELAVSPVSAHEMCRKLTKEGWLTYEPYKGVTLTSEGEQVARKILRRRRLWEVFLVNQLHIDPHEAEAISCRLEHVTPDDVADRLAIFLGHPIYSPQNELIPSSDDEPASLPTCALPNLSVGECGTIAAIHADATTNDFLRAQGLIPGVQIEIVAVAKDGALLIKREDHSLALSQSIAESIAITLVNELVA
ncbi:MAG: hypothetical protein GFH27_549281n49 [Chloroflexi bacterium AL-W]|nr:hypothetical protein [Chloroflexi bacterium AL-N1]NOK65935.1 hypothetical protein [Chloroflexi bacterium AL-N10]NOK72816.1 hypothetical protein [Chloroflexi bacterium AL-N5]NOK79713.1 hypothetical protein [Chloroflexi bacterium AL-W]NOK93038.1 hypothetical protein [Chloroflexi bacterium AL-N15]